MFGKALGRLGITAAKRIPVAGAVIDLLNEDDVVDKFGEITEFIAKKITNKKDEVKLLVNPVEELSPLFVDNINKLNRAVMLGFDTFEKTHEYLNDWLLKTLDGEFGELNADIQCVIAGRLRLGSEWSDFVSITNYIELNPLNESDVQKYLKFRGVKDDKSTKTIQDLSKGIPLWLATLTVQGNVSEYQLIDPTSNAVEYFLKWVDNETYRKAAIICALPRQFNKDTISIFFSENADEIFQWLVVNHSHKKALKKTGSTMILYGKSCLSIYTIKVRMSGLPRMTN